MKLDTRDTFSYSAVQSFLTCPAKYYFSYTEKLRRQNPAPSLATVLGLCVHAAMRDALLTWHAGNYVDTPSQREKVRQVVDWTVGKFVNENCPLLSQYDAETLASLGITQDVDPMVEWELMGRKAAQIAMNTLDDLGMPHRYRVVKHARTGDLLLEWPFKIALDPYGVEGDFTGVIDAVLFDTATSQTVVVDWKVRRSFQEWGTGKLSSQLPLYIYALTLDHALSEDVHAADTGIVYQIRAELPAHPKVNKDGSMSRAACATTWAVYRAALLECGLDPADYADMEAKLRGSKFFDPQIYTYSPETQRNFFAEFVRAALVIQTVVARPRALGYACRMCEFADLCDAYVRGYDEDYVRATRYHSLLDELEETEDADL